MRDLVDVYSGGLEYKYQDREIAVLGAVNPNLLADFDIGQDVYYAEINWANLLKLTGREIKFSDLPKFPEVRRDLSLLIDESITFQEIETLARQAEKKLLKEINLFDYYKGKNIPAGKKSYAVSFMIQDVNKTLTDKEIDKIMAKISRSLQSNLHAELR